jgi:hypothetical protein
LLMDKAYGRVVAEKGDFIVNIRCDKKAVSEV